jgi:hypothetical protein
VSDPLVPLPIKDYIYGQSSKSSTIRCAATNQSQEDVQQDSEEEIEGVIEDELVCLHRENKRLRLVQEHMARRRVVMKRAQVMQQ